MVGLKAELLNSRIFNQARPELTTAKERIFPQESEPAKTNAIKSTKTNGTASVTDSITAERITADTH